MWYFPNSILPAWEFKKKKKKEWDEIKGQVVLDPGKKLKHWD